MEISEITSTSKNKQDMNTIKHKIYSVGLHDMFSNLIDYKYSLMSIDIKNSIEIQVWEMVETSVNDSVKLNVIMKRI